VAAGDGKSPILAAIAEAESGTTGEIRVHLSRSFFEKDVYAHAEKIFFRFGMQKTKYRNAVLLYVNLRRKKFAVYGDEGIHHVVGQPFWEKLARDLRLGLQSTFSEAAIAQAVITIGHALRESFPALDGTANPNELSDTLIED